MAEHRTIVKAGQSVMQIRHPSGRWIDTTDLVPVEFTDSGAMIVRGGDVAIRFGGCDERGVWRCSYCGITGIGFRAGLTVHEETHLITMGDEP